MFSLVQNEKPSQMFELSGGRRLQIPPCERIVSKWNAFTPGSCVRSSKDASMNSIEMPCVKLSKCTAPHRLPSLLRFLSFPFLLTWICIHSSDSGDPVTDIFPLQQKGRLLIVTIPLVFLPRCHFFKCLWGFPSLPPSYISPFSDRWALLLSMALKENSHWMDPVFSHHCPAVTPKKGASCWRYPVEWGCVSHSTWCSVGASPQQALWFAALKDNAPSFLPGPACCSLSIAPAQTWSPSHS